jgi:hypothetical protein
MWNKIAKLYNECGESMKREDAIWTELRDDYVKCAPGRCLSARRPELVEAILKEHDSRRKSIEKLLTAEK